MKTLYNMHPVTSMIYFISVITISMFNVNPFISAISLVAAYFLMTSILGIKTLLNSLKYNAIIIIAISLTNPLFSHNGKTVLFFINNNPITLEAAIYGLNIALTIISVIVWFQCMNRIMTEDKVLFLFGKVSPKFATVASISLRFITITKDKFKSIKQAQKVLGLYSADNSLLGRLKCDLNVFSALITWSLENAVEMGNSMKARGYGLKPRSYYSLFNLKFFDCINIIMIISFDVFYLIGMSKGFLRFYFYPSISFIPLNRSGVIMLLAFSAVCFLPFILFINEEIKWKYYKSKI